MTVPWIELNEDACRQYINTRSTFSAWEEACRGNNKERASALCKSLVRHQRMNWALYVGNAPRLLIEILSRLYTEGLAGQVTVIGPCSLFAYETESAVRLRTGPKPAARNPLILIVDNESLIEIILAIVQKLDKSFVLDQGRVINSKGFAVEVRVEHLGDVRILSSILVAKSGHIARMHTIAPSSAAISGFDKHLTQILLQLPLAVNIGI